MKIKIYLYECIRQIIWILLFTVESDKLKNIWNSQVIVIQFPSSNAFFEPKSFPKIFYYYLNVSINKKSLESHVCNCEFDFQHVYRGPLYDYYLISMNNAFRAIFNSWHIFIFNNDNIATIYYWLSYSDLS